MIFFFFDDLRCFRQGSSPHKGWFPGILQLVSTIGEEWRLEITVINDAVNRRTTRQAIDTMSYDIQSYRPDLLLVQFGMNDCTY